MASEKCIFTKTPKKRPCLLLGVVAISSVSASVGSRLKFALIYL